MIVAGYSLKAWWLGVSVPASIGVVASWGVAVLLGLVIIAVATARHA